MRQGTQGVRLVLGISVEPIRVLCGLVLQQPYLQEELPTILDVWLGYLSKAAQHTVICGIVLRMSVSYDGADRH